MSKIDQLIQEMCPEGVAFKHLWEITVWDKRFNSVEKTKQAKTIKYPHVSAKKLKEIETEGDVKLLSTGKFDGWTNEELAGSSLGRGEVITVPTGGSANLKYWSGKFVDSGNLLGTSLDSSKYSLKYIYYFLLSKNNFVESCFRGSGVKHPDMGQILDLKVPVPPIEVHKEIVNILDKFTQLEAELSAELSAELDARRKQYEYYRNQMLTLNISRGEVKWLTLDAIATNLDSKRKPVTRGVRTSGTIPYYGASGIVDYVKDYIFDGDYLLVSEDGANLLARNTPIAFSVSGKSWINNHAHVLEFENYATRRLVEIYLNSIDLRLYITGAAQPKLNKANLNKIKIPIPSLDEQKRIVSVLDKFDKIVNSIAEGLPAEIKARRQQYEYYRTKLLTFQELPA